MGRAYNRSIKRERVLSLYHELYGDSPSRITYAYSPKQVVYNKWAAQQRGHEGIVLTAEDKVILCKAFGIAVSADGETFFTR